MEDDFVPLSAVAHYAHCPRRCGLVHVERIWQDNRYTVEGNIMHGIAHSGHRESRGDLMVVRSLSIRSCALGVMGVTDVVEFYRSDRGVCLPSHNGKWLPRPVEYKRGAATNDHPYRIQLCAQAVCLEETFGLRLDVASLYIGVDHRRVEIHIDDSLRLETQKLCGQVHDMIRSGMTPNAEYTQKCKSCSLIDVCQPHVCEGRGLVGRWVIERIESALGK